MEKPNASLRLILSLIALLLALPAVVQAQFNFTTNNGTIIITGYTGTNTVVTSPSTTNGYPVTSIGNSAFLRNTNFISVTIPSSVTNIGPSAFSGDFRLALSAFALAMVSSYRQIHYNSPNDLRRPTIMLVNVLLATVVAFGSAVHEGSLTHWADAHLCLRFGLWSAAMFRLLPPILKEDTLFLNHCGSFDLPYGVLGACIHGGLTVLPASFFYCINGLDIACDIPFK